MNNDESFLKATQTWLSTVIVEHGICPFAKKELERGSIRLCVDHNADLENCLLNVVIECSRLDIEPEIEATLLIYAKAFSNYDDYLDFLDLAENLLIRQGYEGTYQVASFHPDYCFDGENTDDPANYTNRSPYPMLHILRESSIEEAVENYPNIGNIPKRNIQFTRGLGLDKMKEMLAACYPGK